MNINEVIAGLDALIGNFMPIINDEVTTVAQDGLALVDRRITREGKNAQGNAFPRYTPGYEAQKKRAGRYRGIVDLQFTGDMWKNTRVVSNTVSGTSVRVVVAGGDKFTQDKIDGNSDLRGDILQVSEKEVQILIDDSRERLFGIINKPFE